METTWSSQRKHIESFDLCFFFDSGNLRFSTLFPLDSAVFALDSSFFSLLKAKEK